MVLELLKCQSFELYSGVKRRLRHKTVYFSSGVPSNARSGRGLSFRSCSLALCNCFARFSHSLMKQCFMSQRGHAPLLGICEFRYDLDVKCLGEERQATARGGKRSRAITHFALSGS